MRPAEPGRASPGARVTSRLALAARAALALLPLACSMPERAPNADAVGDAVVLEWPIDPFRWTATVDGFDPGLEVAPGRRWGFDYDIALDMTRYDEKFGRFTEILVGAIGERRYDAEGFYTSGSNTFALSSNFTTTGVPVERFDTWPKFRLLHGRDGGVLEAVEAHPLASADDAAAHHHLRGRLEIDVPDDAAPGHYEVAVYVLVRVEGVPDPVHVGMYGYGWDGWQPMALPLLRVGAPASPLVPWTVLSNVPSQGRAGTLPAAYDGRAALCHRAGYEAELILPPGTYPLRIGMPSVYVRHLVPLVEGGEMFMPEKLNHFLRLDRGEVDIAVAGPSGRSELGTRTFCGEAPEVTGPVFCEDELMLDLTRTGTYDIELKGDVHEAFGRTFRGGGRFPVTIAYPLTFSTSCKPGTSFLVGDSYPPKVNLIPPVEGHVRVEVSYYPDSDLERAVEWVVEGPANRFGHFSPVDAEPLRFDEPGEYRSVVTATYTDPAGQLWKGQQVSAGVIAPREPTVQLHGTRSFPFNPQLDRPLHGAMERFDDRQRISVPFLPETPYVLMDHFAPVDGQDTIFLPMNFSEDNTVEPHLSLDVGDRALCERLLDGLTERSAIVPPPYQPIDGPWWYLDDVVQVSTDNFGYFEVEETQCEEVPVKSIGRDGLHPSATDDGASIEAYVDMGVVRPGFPVMTIAFQSEATGLYWLASPNRFGYHIGPGRNGDLSGDVYRLQASAVIKDHVRGENHYDAYAASIAVDGGRDSNAIVPPGDRPLTAVGGREQPLFLAMDTHDVLEVGERIGVGGMVFPAVEADVTWTIDKPSGEQVVVRGRANRLGIVRGEVTVPVDEPGLYRIAVDTRHGELQGDVIGTVDGTIWHAAVPADGRRVLQTDLGGARTLDAQQGTALGVSWPDDLDDVTLHVALLMPGQVLDQIELRPRGNHVEYALRPAELSRRFPNLDVRYYGTGEWELADTLVLQLFLEGRDADGPVYDARRLYVRRDMLVDVEAAFAAQGGRGGGAGGGDDRGGGHPAGHPGAGGPDTGPADAPQETSGRESRGSR